MRENRYFTSFHDCVQGRGLRKCRPDPAMVRRELAEAKKDLESAKQSYQESGNKWAIIQGYYSMFHAFKSVLMSAGYNEKSHDCVIMGVEELFTNKGKLPSMIITKIKNAKMLEKLLITDVPTVILQHKQLFRMPKRYTR